MTRVLIILLALCLGVPMTVAAPFDASQSLPGYEALRYTDLLEQMVPPNSAIAAVDIRNMRGEGRDLLLLLVTLQEGKNGAFPPAILAVFTLSAKPQLVDMVEVGDGDVTRLAAGELIGIGRQDQAVLVTSRHAGSNPNADTEQTFYADQLLFLRAGKLQPIGSFKRLDINGCGFRQTQDIAVNTQPAAELYDDILVTITDRGWPTPGDCGQWWSHLPYVTQSSAHYHWQGDAFAADTSQIDALKALTAGRL